MNFLSDFGVQPILLAAQVVNFLLLLFILKKFLYGPLLKVLAQRREKIAESLKNAEEIEELRLKIEQDREKVLAKASEDVQKLLDEAKKEIEGMKEEGRVQAESLAAQIIHKGEIEANAKAEALRQEVMGKVAEIVAVGMEKVTGKSMSKKDQRTLIDREIKNLS
jgi:F-type H+-transporting ATPase subunit b